MCPMSADMGGTEGRWTRGVCQVLNESLGLPSSAMSPMRFTASLRKDETAKTVRPTGVPEKGPTRRSARPAALPRKLRMRRVLVGICLCRDVNPSTGSGRALRRLGHGARRSRLLLGRGFGVPISELVADAEAEVEQGREADEEADDGVEAFEGDDGDQAEGAVIGDGVAEKRGEGRKKGVHGSAVRRENENDYENENDLEDGLLALAATFRRRRSSATRR
jgi:hypothetical protein